MAIVMDSSHYPTASTVTARASNGSFKVAHQSGTGIDNVNLHFFR